MKRIGVAFPGDPSKPSTWSGTPSGVMRGLTAIGAEPVAIRIEPPAVLRTAAEHAVALAYARPGRPVRAASRRARAAALASPALAAVNSRAAPWRLRRAGHLDGIVQIGTGYTLDTDVPIATFEDMTVAQTRGRAYSGWSELSDRAFRSRLERQRRAYERAAACCLTSPWAAESVLRDYGVPAHKVHVIGVGRNHAVAGAAREWTVARLLFVGMDWERKNGPAVLRAFGRLRDERPGATLDLVGQHPPVDLPGVTAHGVLRMTVPEEQLELERLFGRATMFVMPSLCEASGIAYVEAGAAGIPSIGTSSGGSAYFIGSGGLIVDPADGEALLDAMRTLSDPTMAAGMGAEARLRSERFTWPNVARGLVRALDGAPAQRVAA